MNNSMNNNNNIKDFIRFYKILRNINVKLAISDKWTRIVHSDKLKILKSG